MSGRPAHGTLIRRQASGTGAFVEIANLGNITPPSLGRNDIEVTTHNNDIDQYVQGILRRGAVTFPMNFMPNDPSHNHLTGLYASVINHLVDGWELEFPEYLGDPALIWVFSGGISNIVPTAPVDGALTANVTIRPTGEMIIGGVVIGG
jgi:hypothetical protein